MPPANRQLHPPSLVGVLASHPNARTRTCSRQQSRYTGTGSPDVVRRYVQAHELEAAVGVALAHGAGPQNRGVPEATPYVQHTVTHRSDNSSHRPTCHVTPLSDAVIATPSTTAIRDRKRRTAETSVRTPPATLSVSQCIPNRIERRGAHTGRAAGLSPQPLRRLSAGCRLLDLLEMGSFARSSWRAR